MASTFSDVPPSWEDVSLDLFTSRHQGVWARWKLSTTYMTILVTRLPKEGQYECLVRGHVDWHKWLEAKTDEEARSEALRAVKSFVATIAHDLHLLEPKVQEGDEHT